MTADARLASRRPVTIGRSDAGWPGVPGIALLLAGCWLLAGPAGIVAGLAVVACWLLVPAVFAVGVGHVVLAALVAGDPALSDPSVLLPEAGLVWLLLAPAVGLPNARLVVPGALVATVVGVGIVAWLLPSGVALAAAVIVVVLVGGAVGSVALDRLVERIEGGPPS